MPRNTPKPPRMGGIGDVFEDAGTWIANHGDQIADVAEVVVPLVAPYAAPVVAAEHALRKGIELNNAQAKAATTGATAVGKAVAEHVAARQVAGSSEETSSTTRASQELADPDAQGRPNSSSSGLLIIGAVVIGLILFGME